MTGMYATQAVLAALFYRERTGEGQYIDLALLDVQVAMMANMNTNYLVSGEAPKRWGNAHPNLTPYQTFKTKTDWIIAAAGNDEQFRKMCHVGGRSDLPADARFSSNPNRVRNRPQLLPELKRMFANQTAQWWVEALEGVGVPCGPINNLQQTFDNPQVQARGLRFDINRDDSGPVKLVGSPMKFSKTPVQYKRPPPRLGEHTEEVLSQVLGYDEKRIQSVKKPVESGANRPLE
jgi:formyl-CoA transferase